MKYTITCWALLVTVLLHAQTKPVDAGWHFGIKGDVNFSNINGNGMANGYTSGFQFGGFAEKILNSKWSIQPELLFTQNNSKKGADFLTFYNTEGNVFASDNIKLGYISVPIMFKYNMNKYLSILAGPQYSQMLFDAESLLDDNKGIAFKRYEVSGNAGVQFTLGSVSLYGRYNLGLSNINGIDDRYKWHSGHIQTGIAIRIK
ncbi:MAG: porin family protein [Chitinophagaceae bacterium]